MCVCVHVLCMTLFRVLIQWVMTALLTVCVYVCVHVHVLCMTLFRILILTVGHDSNTYSVCVCVCVCERERT